MNKQSGVGVSVDRCSTYELMSGKGADFLIKRVKENPEALICIATGSSPLLMYREFVSRCKAENVRTDKLRFIKLDEWYGLDAENEATCEYYFQTEVAVPLGVSAEQIISFNGKAADPETECERIGALLDAWGPVDVCILGLGKNGHLGLNEPGDFLSASPHLIKLTTVSQGHELLTKADKPVTMGLTLGMASILQAKEILFLVSGSSKSTEFEDFLTENITTKLPASFLWLHPAVSCFVDDSSINSPENREK